MQASIRTAYQYYDYGTLDCNPRLTTVDVNQHQQHAQHHNHLQINEEQTVHLTLAHEQHQSNHQLLHEQQHDLGATSFDQQHQPQQQQETPITCYAIGDQSVVDEQQGSLIVYNQPHQSYHLLDTRNQNIGGQLDGNADGVVEANPCSIEERGEEDGSALELYQHHQQDDQGSIYQTVYYEPISFAATDQQCEPISAQASHVLEEINQQQSIAFAPPSSHLLHPLEPFSTVRQTTVDGYEYHHYSTTNQTTSEVNVFAKPQPQQQLHHHAGSPQPTLITRKDYEGCEQTPHQADQQHHIYQMLELSTGHQYSEQPDQGLAHHHVLQAPSSQVDVHHSQYLDEKQGYHMSNTSAPYLDSESMGASMGHSSQYESHSSAASTSSSEESSVMGSGTTRDERRAREANIPLTYCEIVNLSIEQFNEQLAKHSLTESQLTLIKDIRRRGKNKVAAQSCRKRKMEQIYELQHEVSQLVGKRRSLNFECSQLIKEHENLVQEYDRIYAIIQNRMRLNNTNGASLD